MNYNINTNPDNNISDIYSSEKNDKSADNQDLQEYVLVDEPGRVYKRPREVREKISKSLKGKSKKYTSWLKGRTGPAHPSYIHGKGKSCDYEASKQAAWKEGVLHAYGFKCIVTGATKDLACQHLEAWSICEERRYDFTNGVPIRSDIHKQFHKEYGSSTTTLDFEKFVRDFYSWTNPFPWRQGNHEPSLSVDEIEKKQVLRKEEKKASFKQLLNSRNHTLISGDYQNARSTVVIKCENHGITQTTTFTNYKKCKNGLKCCGQEKQSLCGPCGPSSKRI